MFHYHILDRTKGVNLKHTLLSGEVLLYDLGYTDSRGGIDFPHSHPFHEFYLVISGVACIITENTSRMLRKAKFCMWPLGPGTALIPRAPGTADMSILPLTGFPRGRRREASWSITSPSLPRTSGF